MTLPEKSPAAIYLESTLARARKAFADHQLIGEEYWDAGAGARWVVSRPGTYVYRAEIVAGIGGSLLVHGDIPCIKYGHYGDHSDAWNRLCWMGECGDGYYVAQKASIGMRDANGGEEYDADVAEQEIRRDIASSRKDETPAEAVQVLKDALQYVHERQTLLEFLWREGSQWDLATADYGMVVSGDVIYTHQAMARCCQLLRAKYDGHGPPLCRALAERQSLEKAERKAAEARAVPA